MIGSFRFGTKKLRALCRAWDNSVACPVICEHTYAELNDTFDDRLRYLAIDYGLWQSGNPSWIYLISRLERIFIVVDRKPWMTPDGDIDASWLSEDTGDDDSK
jgi:hypothetical protein